MAAKKRRSLAARLRAAQDMNTELRRELNSAKNQNEIFRGEYSGVEIVSDVLITDWASGAVKTARMLGAIVTVHPDPRNHLRFIFRAKFAR